MNAPDDAVLGADHAPDDDLDELIHRADLDALVRMIDDRTSARDWAGLLRVRDRSRRAVETGRQLWPAATLAEFRLALLAPAEFVGIVLDESDGLSGRFTIGPLSEVAAQHHRWTDLEPHLERGPRAAFVAHECALRGEEIPDRDAASLPPVLEIPVAPRRWEPAYPLATYTDHGAEFPRPELPDRWTEIEASGEAEVLDDPDVDLAVRQLVEPWMTSSNGQLDVVCAEGDAVAAVGALGARRARVAELTPDAAMAWIAWAGASGGAHGRRRGAAAGRFGLWWLLASIGDLVDDFPPTDRDVEQLLDSLRFWRWDAYEPDVGWSLQVAIDDVDDGVAWAIAARDAR